MSDTGWKSMMREKAHNFLKWGEYMKRAQLAERKVEKLKGLLLLTDNCVSNVVVGETQLKQWNSYLEAFPDEAQLTTTAEKL